MAGFIEEINYNKSYLLFHKNILDNYHNICADFVLKTGKLYSSIASKTINIRWITTGSQQY